MVASTHQQGRSYVQEYEYKTPTDSDEQFGETDVGRTVEVFFRSLSEPEPHQFQRNLLGMLERLQEAGAVDDYRISLLGGKLCCCEACVEMAATRERLAEIDQWRSWADRAGVALCLEEHSVDSSITGEQYRFVVPPTATVVCRVDGDIRSVLPHRVDGEVITPYEYLSTFPEAGLMDSTVSPDAEETAD
jgi:hypothetical protein